ncbi:hypothetical protein EDB92DRAFT_1813405 [Lactarius akahatsu]|uniref:Uncharacterized protein n=1 Tax=Lactarius akahatsu TaxID=416441 RepID=A0AAD4QGZ7_9AGAM|nr:hypothetical protein EDB92DRAFT_1813405 [Lactarius akahatsu]
MSSTTTTSSAFPSASPTDPQSGSPPPQNNNGGGPSSSLYLFTFLATLFLLLFVSSAIILRSFILRRRFRQRIEEAILAGVIVPNQTGRVSRRRALGEKPKLWEARVFPADDDRWDSIVPVSAVPKAKEDREETSAPPRPLSDFVQAPYRPPLHRRLLRNPFSRRADSSMTTPRDSAAGAPTSSGENPSEQGTLAHHDRMQVTVLIAMPDPRRPHLDGKSYPKGKEKSLDFDYDEDDLPEMVLGMVEPSYKDISTPPRSP